MARESTRPPRTDRSSPSATPPPPRPSPPSTSPWKPPLTRLPLVVTPPASLKHRFGAASPPLHPYPLSLFVFCCSCSGPSGFSCKAFSHTCKITVRRSLLSICVYWCFVLTLTNLAHLNIQVFRFVTDKSSSSEHPFFVCFVSSFFSFLFFPFFFLPSPYATCKHHTAGLV